MKLHLDARFRALLRIIEEFKPSTLEELHNIIYVVGKKYGAEYCDWVEVEPGSYRSTHLDYDLAALEMRGLIIISRGRVVLTARGLEYIKLVADAVRRSTNTLLAYSRLHGNARSQG